MLPSSRGLKFSLLDPPYIDFYIFVCQKALCPKYDTKNAI